MRRSLLAALVATAGVVLSAAPASAAPTESAVLDCGTSSVVVTGFGRGQALHVVDSRSRFVVTSAVSGDRVVFDSPAASDRPVVTCTTVTPQGVAYTFEGFFTPAS